MSELDGRTILIVGATGEIGGSCVSLCERGGAVVLATGRRPASLVVVRETLNQPGSQVFHLDLEEPASWAEILEHETVLDGVVFAAGITSVKPLRAQLEVDFQRIMHVNFEAPALLTRELLRRKRIAKGASIVYIGSIAGRIGAMGHAAYSASKAALAGFTRSLALEVSSSRVRVNTVSPGLVGAGMLNAMGQSLTVEQLKSYAQTYPLGLGRPDDVGSAVVFLLSPGSRWITGIELIVDGGASHT